MWHAELCLLLGVLFLYNPFFTVHSIPGDLQVRHPLSYRATIASSELRRCRIDPTKPPIPAVGLLQVWVLGSIALPASTSPLFSPRQHDGFSRVTQQVVLEGLWFRPPPVLAN
jgi:hypothetical protein